MCDLLSKKSLNALGYLNPIEVERIISEHLAGRMNHENKLWGLINLVLWHRQQISRRWD
jgi:asparagine synthase (glutamine-hydrolysing)